MPRRLDEAGKGKMVIETVSIVSINPHSRNPRVHNEKNLQAIMASIQEFGQQVPIIIGSKDQIIKGCGTWEAMRRLKFIDVQIARASGMTETQELAFALADNKTTDMSEFDFETVADILKFLDDEGFDLAKTGFQSFEIEPLLQANWDPGQPGDMPTAKDSGGLKVVFDEEQAVTITLALKEYRRENEMTPETRDQDVLVSMCNLYLSGLAAEAPRKKPKRIS